MPAARNQSRASTLLENVQVLAIGATSGIIAGGSVFTMPAIYILGLEGRSSFFQIFFVPLLGVAIGAGIGALMGHFSDFGISKDFIDSVKSKVVPGTSALFLMTSSANTEKVAEEVKKAGLKAELTEKLLALTDPVTGRKAIHAVHDSAVVYKGPYAGNGPDLLVGFAEGYRASWRAAAGEVEDEVFTDNSKSWSGDHSIDRSQVPGMFFCNRKLDVGKGIGLIDIAPTILDWFGVPVPGHMDGKVVR